MLVLINYPADENVTSKKKKKKGIQSQEMQPTNTEMLDVYVYPMLITSDPIVQIASSSF